MMGVRGLTAADKAGLRGNELAMCFVADTPRFADRKHAFVDPATDAAARVIKPARIHSRIASVRPRKRYRNMGHHFGGSHRGRLSFGVGMKARLRPGLALDGLRQPVSGPPIVEFREPCPEACLDKLGVGGRQRVLGRQAPVGPDGGFVGGLEGVELGDQYGRLSIDK